MASKKLLTPEQVKNNFQSRGITFSDWAKARGYHPRAVYQVLNGFTKANRGAAHKIAVELGIKAEPDQQAA